jgi:hypothetical protein
MCYSDLEFISVPVSLLSLWYTQIINTAKKFNTQIVLTQTLVVKKIIKHSWSYDKKTNTSISKIHGVQLNAAPVHRIYKTIHNGILKWPMTLPTLQYCILHYCRIAHHTADIVNCCIATNNVLQYTVPNSTFKTTFWRTKNLGTWL